MVGGGIIVSTFKKISWPRAPLGEIAPSVYTLFCSPVGILLLLSNSVDLCLRAKSVTSYCRKPNISCLCFLVESKVESFLA
jgi:hypothetical protein